MAEARANNDLMDVVKFILSLVVVSLHTSCLPDVAIPLQRLAVPLFFLISSYLFFNREKGLTHEASRRHALRFISRAAGLYGFWFVVLLPLTVYMRRAWFEGGVLLGLAHFLFNILFGSTFVASWFISALVIGVCLIKCIGSRQWLGWVLAIGMYLLVTMSSSYSNAFPFTRNLEQGWWLPCNSFPAAIFWVWCGRCVAERPFPAMCGKAMPFALAAGFLLYAEWLVVGHLYGTWKNDAYFFLAPVALPVFLMLTRLRISVAYARQLRKLSVVVYVLHGAMLYVFTSVLKHVGIDYARHPCMCFFAVILATLLCGCLILNAESKWKWLEHAH